jgi:hypothetical protein
VEILDRKWNQMDQMGKRLRNGFLKDCTLLKESCGELTQ